MTARQVTRKVWSCKCERCGHKWETKTDALPKTCPNVKCKSPFWVTKRRVKKQINFGDLNRKTEKG